MLVSANNGRVDHHVFVVVVDCQHLENTFEDPALRPPAKALVDDFPITETLGEITPRNAGSISVENGLNKQSIISCCAADMAFAARKKILDPVPLVIAQCITSHRSAPPQADHP